MIKKFKLIKISCNESIYWLSSGPWNCKIGAWLLPPKCSVYGSSVYGAVRQQVITWADVDQDLCHHMALLGHNELIESVLHVANKWWVRIVPDSDFTLTSNKLKHLSWWRHQMETFSTLLAICAGKSLDKGQWHGALMFSLICAHKWLSKQSWGWWF